jgi:hypothetical protein
MRPTSRHSDGALPRHHGRGLPVQAARLPLNPADRTPQRRRALASAATLAQLHPNDHQARYHTELAAICSGDGAWVVKSG